MDLSIIIVNYCAWKHLKECLDSLASFSGKPLQPEVIIVDNDSPDRFIDEFKSDYPDFIFIRNNVNGGYGNGCNLGSTFAKGDFILFLNPDTIVSENVVKKLLERAKENPENYISSCRQLRKNGKECRVSRLFPRFGTLTGFERTIYSVLNRKRIAEKTEGKGNLIKPDWVSGSVLLIKKELFLSLGGFDEDFWMYSEDTDLCRRARDMNGNIAYYTDITIRHNHGGSSRINLKTTSLTKTEVIISNHLYIAKHKSGTGRFMIQSYLVLYNLITGGFMALLGVLFFAKPKMFIQVNIYGRLISYYFGALKHRSWISPRSVNFKKNNLISG